MTARAQEIRRGLAHLRAVDPVLGKLIDGHPDVSPDAWLPPMDLFGALVFQIIGQQISVTAARAEIGLRWTPCRSLASSLLIATARSSE
ncbi:MAG TPA: hypothetical protein VGJ28_14880 [Micromonosporaceae bacterium]|jgi:3-methyladenine DNA glycosylase/8-oxoguanine DNA glycosylase